MTYSAQAITKALHKVSNAYLDWLEAKAIYVMREVAAQFERPVLLFYRAESLCARAHSLPPASHRYRPQLPETLAFRDRLA